MALAVGQEIFQKSAIKSFKIKAIDKTIFDKF